GRHFVERGAETRADRGRIERAGHGGQVDQDAGAGRRFTYVDAAPGRRFAEIADLLVELITDHSAGHAADARTHDARGLAADEAAEQVPEPRASDAADRGARNVSFAGVRVGHARGDTQERDRRQARDENSRLVHMLSSQGADPGPRRRPEWPG